MDNKKDIKEMTNAEILRQQLELLAKESEVSHGKELLDLTHAMVEIYSVSVLRDSSLL